MDTRKILNVTVGMNSNQERKQMRKNEKIKVCLKNIMS